MTKTRKKTGSGSSNAPDALAPDSDLHAQQLDSDACVTPLQASTPAGEDRWINYNYTYVRVRLIYSHTRHTPPSPLPTIPSARSLHSVYIVCGAPIIC